MHRSTLVRLVARLVPALIAVPLLVVMGSQSAQAHGNVSDPPSRNFRCYTVWAAQWTSPTMGNTDPMCAQAWRANEGAAMWLWMGLLRDGAAGDFQRAVPDGTLCSGGNTANGTYDVLDVPGSWIPTPKERTFTLNLRDDSSHGADYLQIYVSKQGYDPTTKRLAWSDLTLLKQTPRFGPMNNYRTEVTVPADMTGHHVLYTVWQASHLDQTYFFCSDVSFPGGPGPTSTPTPTRTPTPSVTPTRTPTPTVTPTIPVTPTPTRTTTPTPSVTPTRTPTPTTPVTPTASGSKSCSATYKTVGQWQNGFQSEVTVTAGGAPITGWTVNWTWPGTQAVSQSWSSTVTSSSSVVTARNVAWNGTLGAGASSSFGFIGTYTGTNAAPVLTCTAV